MRARRMRVVVAEYEAQSRNSLVRMLEDAGCVVVNSFSQGRRAQEWLGEHRDVEAVFLDINMPNLGGMEILKALGRYLPMVVTALHPDLAAEAFDSEAVDYLIKPVTASRLERALRRVESRWSQAPAGVAPGPKRFPVHAGQGVVFVDLQKTTHFEVEREVVWAHAGGRMRTQWKSLGEVQAAFPDSGLLRIHRHLLVRLEAVLGMKPAGGGRALVMLAGGKEIEASRGGAPRLKEYFGMGGPGFPRGVV